MPVAAAGEVAVLALRRTYDIVTHMMTGRPEVLDASVKNKMDLIIIGKDRVYTDMPEYRNHPNPAPIASGLEIQAIIPARIIFFAYPVEPVRKGEPIIPKRFLEILCPARNKRSELPFRIPR